MLCVNTLHFELAPMWKKSPFEDWYKQNMTEL